MSDFCVADEPKIFMKNFDWPENDAPSAPVKVEMYHETDPKQDIFDRLGDISNVKLLYNRVLVATYKRPEKTKGGLLIPETSRDEDEYQGKVGLVIILGERAFKDDEKINVDFHGQNIKVGDWVWYYPGLGRQLKLRGVHCRLFDMETQIIGPISDPDEIW